MQLAELYANETLRFISWTERERHPEDEANARPDTVGGGRRERAEGRPGGGAEEDKGDRSKYYC